jgi:hypothetical protein
MMKVEVFVLTNLGGAAHRWQRLCGKGNEASGSLGSAIGRKERLECTSVAKRRTRTSPIPDRRRCCADGASLSDMVSRCSMSRRELVRGAAALAGASLVLDSAAFAGEPAGQADVLDAALAHLAPTGPEFGGLSNHGPMVAEALVTLGRSEAVLPWVDQYRKRLQENPTERNRIIGDSWPTALGDFTRVGDLAALYRRELAARPWRSVLATWMPRLAPGLCAASLHGVLRTAHAARSLGRSETEQRRRELAEGLGYWASRYQELPSMAHAAPAHSRPSQVAPGLERLSPDATVRSFAASMRRLDRLPSFPGAIDLVDTSGDPAAFLSDLTAIFARIYLANADTRTIAFIHGVTGPSAVRLLVPFVDGKARRDLLRHTWHAAAGLYCSLGQKPPDIHPRASKPPRNRDAIIDDAVATQDEHAIKFTEACLRENAVAPDPIFLAAAEDAIRRLG